MRTSSPSPFIVGNSVGGTSAFVGRAAIFTKVDEYLRQPAETSLVLYGQRRIGKSSLLHQLRVCLPKMGPWDPVYFDLHGRARMPVEQILCELAEAITRTTRSSTGSRPEFPPLPREDTSAQAFRAWLGAGLRALAPGRRLVFLFDEFDVLTEPSGESRVHELFAVLAELLGGETSQQIATIYAMGRTMDDLSGAARPLLRGAILIPVSTLERREFELLLDLGEQGGGLCWGEGTRDAIWGLTGGHPLLTQLIGSTLWHALQQAGTGKVSVAMVQEVVPTVLKESRNMLSWLWDGLTPACRVAIAAIAEHKDRAVTVEALATILRDSGVRIIISQLSDAPKRLRAWDLLEESEGTYYFKVELLRLWICKYQPFSAVRECLDEVVPQANDYFRRASEIWQGAEALGPQQVTSIVVLLESILNDPRMNPNHVGAALLLADVYVHQGRRDEAIRLLEHHHPSQPAAIGPRYVQLLLQQVEKLSGEFTEDERLGLYEKILQAAPRTAEAVGGRTAIWRERGQRSRAAGRLKEARDHFVRAEEQELAQELTRELERLQAESLLQEARRLEQEGKLREAQAGVAEAQVFIGERCDLVELRERLRRRVAAEELMKSAMAALRNSDRDVAIERLCQVLQLERGHREASRELANLLRWRFDWPRWFFRVMSVILLLVVVIASRSPPLPPPPAQQATCSEAVGRSEVDESLPVQGPLESQPEAELPREVELSREASPRQEVTPTPAAVPPPRPAGRLAQRPQRPQRPEPPSPGAKAACDKGNDWACYGIAMTYLGQGEPDAAIPYLMISCDHGSGPHADSCCRLAEVYREGPNPQPVLAARYRDKAHRNGHMSCLPESQAPQPGPAVPEPEHLVMPPVEGGSSDSAAGLPETQYFPTDSRPEFSLEDGSRVGG